MRFHNQGVREEVGFQHREVPFDHQSVMFVSPRGNRQGRMREEQSPGSLHLSKNRNTNEAVQRCQCGQRRTIELLRTPNAKYNVKPRLDR